MTRPRHSRLARRSKCNGWTCLGKMGPIRTLRYINGGGSASCFEATHPRSLHHGLCGHSRPGTSYGDFAVKRCAIGLEIATIHTRSVRPHWCPSVGLWISRSLRARLGARFSPGTLESDPLPSSCTDSTATGLGGCPTLGCSQPDSGALEIALRCPALALYAAAPPLPAPYIAIPSLDAQHHVARSGLQASPGAHLHLPTQLALYAWSLYGIWEQAAYVLVAVFLITSPAHQALRSPPAL